MPVERAMTAYTKERLNCAQSVLRGFQQRQNIGEGKCREIRRVTRVPCHECVRLAVSLLIEHGGTPPAQSAAPETERAAPRGEQPC